MPDLPGHGTAELLDHGPERDPWRPSRRLVALGAAIAVAAALVGWVRHAQHEQALDTAAAAAVQFVVQPDHQVALVSDVVSFQLFSTDAALVRLEHVRLVAPGATDLAGGTWVEREEFVPLTEPDQLPCSPTLLRRPITQLEVVASTQRHVTVRRTVPLGAELSRRLYAHLRFRCGVPEPADALQWSIDGWSLRGRSVDVSLSLTNAARQRLTISQLVPFPGLEVTASTLPVTLQALASPTSPHLFVEVSLTLAVRDCTALRQALVRRGPPPPGLQALVSVGQDQARVDLAQTQDPGAPSYESAPSSLPLSELAAACGGAR